MDSKTYNALIERMNYLKIKKSYYNSKIAKLEEKLKSVDNEIDNYKKVNNIEISFEKYFITKNNNRIYNDELKQFINNNKIKLSLNELKIMLIKEYNADDLIYHRGLKHIDFKLN